MPVDEEDCSRGLEYLGWDDPIPTSVSLVGTVGNILTQKRADSELMDGFN